MNKKFFLGITALAVAFVSGYNVYRVNVNSVKLSDLAMANVEALSMNETNPNGYCYSDVRTEIENKQPSNGEEILIKHCVHYSCYSSSNDGNCKDGSKCDFPTEPHNSYDNVFDMPCVK